MPVDVNDKKAIEKWLKDRPYASRVGFASRSAARVLPLTMDQFSGGDGDYLMPLMTFRSILISAAASTWPAAEIKGLRTAAFSASAVSAASASAFYAAEAASDAASASGADIEFLSDLDSADVALLWNRPLWPAGDMPDTLMAKWQGFQRQAATTEWAFWADWYQGLLDGAPMDWDLVHKIVLIDDEIWQTGAKAIAAEIDKIRANMVIAKLPMAEKIMFDRGIGKFRAIPIAVQNPPLSEALLTQLQDALKDCLGGHNGLSQHSGDVKKINRVLSDYRDDPQNIELTLTVVAGSLRRQLHDSKELPDNADNLALLSTVEETVRGYRANHPEVAQNRAILAGQKFKSLRPEDQQTLKEGLPVLAALGDQRLADDFRRDIPALINDAILPPGKGAPTLPPADAATRVFNRASNIELLLNAMKPVKEKGAEVFDSKFVKTLRLIEFTVGAVGAVGAAGALLVAIVKIGLFVLGVL